MSRPVGAGRRFELLDAALEVVVQHGLRGLTHRAVDRAASVAEGTTSAYFRTRQALHLGLAERVTSRLADDVDQVAREIGGCDASSPEALAAVVGMFTRWLDESPLLLAKVELMLEAGRDPELAAVVSPDRERVVGVVTEVLAARGAEEPGRSAAVMVASFDGVLLAALTLPPDRRDAFVADAVQVTLRPLSDAG